jgi:hypothetical protein
MTMIPLTPPLSPNLEQILMLVRQLPDGDKLRLSRELEKETRNSTLSRLLESFKTDELSLETINEEVAAVKTEAYDKQQSHLRL